jgi:hypothetical protein
MHREEELTQIFAQLAENISGRYVIDIQATTAIKGSRPPFEELMQLLQQMDKELTTQGVKILEAYKADTGKLSDSITDSFKRIISETVEQFVKQL